MDLSVIDKTDTLTDEQVSLVSTLLEFASRQDGCKLPADTEMSVTFVTNDEIKTINKTYRQKDTATDVISFALEEIGEDEVPIMMDEIDIPRNIGDIVVSVEKIKEQANELNHSFERELGFLIVHGFLHLNGYDHMNETDEKEMFDLQRRILEKYGLKR